MRRSVPPVGNRRCQVCGTARLRGGPPGLSAHWSTSPAAVPGPASCPNCGRATRSVLFRQCGPSLDTRRSATASPAAGTRVQEPLELPGLGSCCLRLLPVHLPGVALTWWFWKKTQARHAEFDSAHLAWREVMGRWDATDHCARCHGVFIPGQTPFIPAGPQSAAIFAARPS